MTSVRLDKMRAMILAAGAGKRMLPLTSQVPKPLLQVAGRPLLERHLDHLAACGIAKVVVNVHHQGDKIEEYLASRATASPRVVVSREEHVLETGGGIKQALPLLGDGPFFILNGDIAWLDHKGATPALERLAQFWNGQHMDVLMLTVPLSAATGHQGIGNLVADYRGRLTWSDQTTSDSLVFAGLLVTTSALYRDVPEEAFSQRLLWEQAERAGRLFGLMHDGLWFHIGDPQALQLARACWPS